VHFIHSEPAYRSEYERVFRAPCYFDSEHNAFVIREQAAALPLPTADAALCRLMKRQARELLEQLPSRRPFRALVQDAIKAEFASSGASLRHVARRLGLSESSLRRRLRAQNTSYSENVDATRRQRVEELLAYSTDSLEQIALASGFSHATALHRAFRRWHGLTPEQFRKKFEGEPPASPKLTRTSDSSHEP
jgi:AraC-like DNA-binding protein